jgi:hypothetical protein
MFTHSGSGRVKRGTHISPDWLVYWVAIGGKTKKRMSESSKKPIGKVGIERRAVAHVGRFLLACPGARGKER